MAVAIDLVGFGLVFPILPLYARRFHVSSATATGLVSAFAAASFLFSPIWGRISDRIGRKPVLVLSLAGTCVGSLLTGLAGGIALLYVGRVIDGISGASVSVAQAAVSDVATPEQRARLFGLLGAAFGIGFVAGPALGALAELAGPRVPFYVAAALAGINCLVAIRRLPETHHPGERIQPGDRIQPGERTQPGERIQPGPATADFAPSVVRPRNPLAALAGGRGVGTLIGVAFGALMAFSAFEATFALFGQRRLGFGVGSSAAVFAALGLVIVGVQVAVVHKVVTRIGETATLRAGLLIDTVGLLVLAFAHTWLGLVPALLALTVGQGLVQTTMSSTLAGRADPARRGEVLGAQQSAGGLARVVGPLLGGVLFQRVGPGAPYVVGAAVMAVVLLLLQAATGSQQPTVVTT
ncbi:MAG: transporter, family, tetracycline resistance protein [Acidimicrobiaceae bacterium]|nr:transporter, family, tetracycline resistance protein [Acidimicrobiaceae bacterium]